MEACGAVYAGELVGDDRQALRGREVFAGKDDARDTRGASIEQSHLQVVVVELRFLQMGVAVEQLHYLLVPSATASSSFLNNGSGFCSTLPDTGREACQPASSRSPAFPSISCSRWDENGTYGENATFSTSMAPMA